eukprot:comp17473_c0_seq1/m.16947 comp17473_c0_seq1/g.16947  ORF comp17473_c0_seq1/g.16947 comp17473_c0_seq1/m.16947 type:complete len:281 (-) comp17473_c0_seq1:655-1497(-)
MAYVQVMSETSPSADVVEVPLDNDFLSLATLQSTFDGAAGLKYRNEETKAMRVVKLQDGQFHPPEGGWAGRIYLVVTKKDDGAGGVKRGAGEESVDQDSKRARENCFRCGGNGHIADMCTSPWDSKNMAGGQECYLCKGKGHVKMRCPNAIPRGMCYKCHQFGHNGRDCRGMAGQMGGNMGGWGGAAPGFGGYGAPGMGMGGYGAPQQGFGMQVCYRCQQPGHRSNECPKLKEQGLTADSCFKCGREGHRSKDCDVCYLCKNPGHFANTCPTKSGTGAAF